MQVKTIQQFLSEADLENDPPEEGEAGVFTEWLPFHRLEIRGHALQFVEKRVVGIRGEHEYECTEVPAQPGTYVVECRGVQYKGDRRVAAMRAFPEGASVSRGRQVKELPVDLGGISVVDIDIVGPSIEAEVELYEDWHEDWLYSPSSELDVSVDTWPGTGSEIATTESGFGDGSYPTFELVQAGAPVGLEVVFIEEDTPYPFASS